MRRIVLGSVIGGIAIGGIVVAVLIARADDDGSRVSSPTVSTTTTTSLPGAGSAGDPVVTTTTDARAPIESTGAAPVDGAILSEEVEASGDGIDVGEETRCDELDPEFEAVACGRVQGSGGHFLVAVGRNDAGALRSALYRAPESGSTTFTPVARSKVFEPDVEVIGITLAEFDVGGEPVVIVDYDFDGSGSVHSFDVVAWDGADAGPRVVAFIGGTGGDRFHPEGDALQFVGANYDDGAPTCCPNFADVRTLSRSGPGGWELTEDTVPFAEAP